MRLPLFSQGLFRDLVLQHGFSQQALEPSIFGFQLLESLGIRDRYAAELCCAIDSSSLTRNRACGTTLLPVALIQRPSGSQ